MRGEWPTLRTLKVPHGPPHDRDLRIDLNPGLKLRRLGAPARGVGAHLLAEVHQIVHRFFDKRSRHRWNQSPGIDTIRTSTSALRLSREISAMAKRCRTAVAVAARVEVSMAR